MKKRLSVFIVCIGSVLFSAPSTSADYGYDNASPRMAEAMWDMMDWMRNDQNQGGLPFNFGSNPMPGVGGFPGMMAVPGMSGGSFDNMPLMSPFSSAIDPGSWAQFPNQIESFSKRGQVQQDGGSHGKKWPVSHRLDGVWKGQSGEYFMIKGEQFSLVSSAGDRIDGRIRIVSDRIQTYIPVSEQVREYQFVKIGEMLMMRDETDQTLVFNRLQR